MLKLNGTVIEPTMFPDNTSQVWMLDDSVLLQAIDAKNAVVDWHFSHEGEVMQLVQLNTLLEHYGLWATLRIFYLPYARQDKCVGNYETFAVHSLGAVFSAMTWKRVVILDPHSKAACKAVRGVPVFPDTMVRTLLQGGGYGAICYPDEGAAKKYRYHTAGWSGAVLVGRKDRDQRTGAISGVSVTGPDGWRKGAGVLIVDDICDGGRTFIEAAKAIRSRYPSSASAASGIDLFTTHGIYSQGLGALKAELRNVYCYRGVVSEVQGAIAYQSFPRDWGEEELLC